MQSKKIDLNFSSNHHIDNIIMELSKADSHALEECRLMIPSAGYSREFVLNDKMLNKTSELLDADKEI